MIDLKDETFDGTFPFAPHYHEVNGHFLQEDAPERILSGIERFLDAHP